MNLGILQASLETNGLLANLLMYIMTIRQTEFSNTKISIN